MRLRGIPITLATGADIDRLVADNVNEDARLDFKQTLYRYRGGATAVPADQAAEDLCKDVASLANARGGVIVCGLAANKGVASKVVGVAQSDIDAETLWIEPTLKKVQPSIPGVHLTQVTTASGAVVLLIGVPASLARPHAFTPATGMPPQWWRRGQAGNVPMDVTELRTLFLEMSTWEREAKVWREERFRLLQEGITVPRLPDRPTAVVHMQPLGGPRDPVSGPPGFTGAYPIWLHNFLPKDLALGPILARPTIDGWQYTLSQPKVATHQAQVFRANGAVEVRLELPHLLLPAGPAWNRRELPGPKLELLLVGTVKTTFLWADLVDLEGPFLVSIRLFNVMALQLNTQGIQTTEVGDYAFDRPIVDLPQLLVESPPEDVIGTMQPMRDALWQAAGWALSPVRGADGTPPYASVVKGLTWRPS
jgi:hypothetical protein